MSERSLDLTSLPSTDFRAESPAKLNLHLRVGRVRPDGFHPLGSWMVLAGLFDKLRLTVGGGKGLSLTCSDPALPTDGNNLVTRAATAVLAEPRGPWEGAPASVGTAAAARVAIHLEKHIPTGGGLGGGSGNAATTLRLVRDHLRPDVTDSRMSELAASLGSDVPFFLNGRGSAWCEGRGDRVEPIARPKPSHAVLLLPGLHLSTAAVYRRFDERPPSTENLARPELARWATLDAADLLGELVNDLEPPAEDLCPSLRSLRLEAARLANRPVRMSGSGSTLFTLADDGDDAARVVERWNELDVPSAVVGL